MSLYRSSEMFASWFQRRDFFNMSVCTPSNPIRLAQMMRLAHLARVESVFESLSIDLIYLSFYTGLDVVHTWALRQGFKQFPQDLI